jgi:serine/threonine-protein kinase
MVRVVNDRYHILQPLSDGRFGKIFLAEDGSSSSQRRCVIKQLKLVLNVLKSLGEG